MAVNAPAPMEAIRSAPSMGEAAFLKATHIPGGKELAARGGSAKPHVENLIKAKSRAEELRQFDKAHKDPAETVLEAKNKRTQVLSPTELKQLDKIDPTLAQEARQFNTYSEVMAEAIKKGETPEDIAKAHGILPKEFSTTRREVVGRLTKLDIFQEMEGFNDATAEQKRIIVESTFGTNDRVRALYLQGMREVSREAIKLPEDQNSKNKNESKQQRTEIQLKGDAALNNLHAQLGEAGKQLSDTELRQVMTESRDLGEAKTKLFDKLLDKNNVSSADVRQRDMLQARVSTLNIQIQALDAQIKAKSGDTHALTTERDALRIRVQESGKALSAIVITPEQQMLIDSIDRTVYGAQDFRQGGALVGGVESELIAVIDNKKLAETTASKIPLSEDQVQLQREAEAERTVLQEKMRNLLSESVESAWGEQIEETRNIMERKVLAETADKDKAELTQKDNALIRIIEQQSYNWIGMDRNKGTRTVNYDQIGSDVRYLVNEGKDGVKRLILRDLMMGGDGAIIKIADGSGVELRMNEEGNLVKPDGSEYKITVPVRGDDGNITNQEQTATWRNLPYESLPESSKNMLNTLQTEQGDAYATRLIMDMEQARHPHSLPEAIKVIGKLPTLNLKRDQITALYTTFGDLLTNGIQGAKDAEQILDKLAAQGMSVTERGGKGLGALLIILMTLVGFGVPKKEE